MTTLEMFAVMNAALDKMPPPAPFTVTIPWGTFGPGGSWQPHLGLSINPDEQHRQNRLNGFIPALSLKNK